MKRFYLDYHANITLFCVMIKVVAIRQDFT